MRRPPYSTVTASRPANLYLTTRRLLALHTGTLRSLRRVCGDIVDAGTSSRQPPAGLRKLPVNPLAGIGGPSVPSTRFPSGGIPPQLPPWFASGASGWNAPSSSKVPSRPTTPSFPPWTRPTCAQTRCPSFERETDRPHGSPPSGSSARRLVSRDDPG